MSIPGSHKLDLADAMKPLPKASMAALLIGAAWYSERSFRSVRVTSILRFFAVTCLLAPASADTLDVYGNLLGKTILAPSALPSLPDWTISDLPPDKTNAIAFLENEFSKKGISVVQDGPSFVRLLRSGEWQAGLSNAPLRGAQLRASPTKEMIPAGAVNFPGTDLTQVLNVYAELKNRTILRPRFLPSPSVRFKNQCPLTREELVYALETVLALNGISTVDDGQAFVQIVPTQLLSQVNTNAPKAEPGTRLFDPKKVPSMGYSATPQPQTELERDLERWQKAFSDFLRLNSTRNSSMQRLLELYANLTDKKAESSKDYETQPVWFHVTTPLSKSELLYAIEATFALNNLAITPVGKNAIRLGPNMKPGKDAGRRVASQDPKL
jgi:hypothetical protein